MRETWETPMKRLPYRARRGRCVPDVERGAAKHLPLKDEVGGRGAVGIEDLGHDAWNQHRSHPGTTGSLSFTRCSLRNVNVAVLV